MHDDSIADVVFGAVWVAIALAGPLLSRAKKKRRRREEEAFREKAALESLRPGARPRGGAERPRAVIRPRPAPAAAPAAPPPRPAPENLARYGMAEDGPALAGASVADILRQLEERRAERRTAAERAAAEARAAADAERERRRAAAQAEAARRAEEAERLREAERAAAAAAPRDVLAGLLAGTPGETRAAALRRAVLLHEIFGRPSFGRA